ncbi:uncharacterized protein VP01_272g7 [Puccinia sorghi]|uniref:Uncharacterized protein n=1 Tax=Puccinia sorghi TaxID=27349 RepID=A0A0L6V389_9BASI|nr:uncharacterized protein VP01_272g7 [Puccinia sorghi]
MPPNRSYHPQARLRQLYIPKLHDWKILLNSGASTHISGSLDLFINKEELVKPRTILLVVDDCYFAFRFKRMNLMTIKRGNLRIE